MPASTEASLTLSPGERVFGLPELAGMIFLHLPLPDLVRAKRINKSTNANAVWDPELRHRLSYFDKPVPADASHLWDANTGEYVEKTAETAIFHPFFHHLVSEWVSQGIGTTLVHIDRNVVEAKMQSSVKGALIQQPSAFKLYVSPFSGPSGNVNTYDELVSGIYEEEDRAGVRMHHLLACVRRQGQRDQKPVDQLECRIWDDTACRAGVFGARPPLFHWDRIIERDWHRQRR